MATIEARPQITLHLPSDVPPETVLDITQETLHDFSNLLSQFALDQDTTVAISYPERHFLIEVGTLQLAVTIALGGTASAGAVYALKKIIEVVAEIVKTTNTEAIRENTEIKIAQRKAEIEIEKERVLLKLQQEETWESETLASPDALQELGDHTVPAFVRAAIVERLRRRGYNAF